MRIGLPSLEREIKVQEKRMRTLAGLETALTNFKKEIRDVAVLCPFGEDSLEIQSVVNMASSWSTEFGFVLRATHNDAIIQHNQDVAVLAEHEGVVPTDQEVAEDTFAILKSNLLEELLAAKTVREFDREQEEYFNQKISALEEQFLGTLPKNPHLQNKTNDNYSIVE